MHLLELQSSKRQDTFDNVTTVKWKKDPFAKMRDNSKNGNWHTAVQNAPWDILKAATSADAQEQLWRCSKVQRWIPCSKKIPNNQTFSIWTWNSLPVLYPFLSSFQLFNLYLPLNSYLHVYQGESPVTGVPNVEPWGGDLAALCERTVYNTTCWWTLGRGDLHFIWNWNLFF